MTEPAAHDRRLVFLFGLSVASKEHHHTAGTHLGITTCRSALDLPVLMQLAQQLGSLAWMTPSANCMVTFIFPFSQGSSLLDTLLCRFAETSIAWSIEVSLLSAHLQVGVVGCIRSMGD